MSGRSSWCQWRRCSGREGRWIARMLDQPKVDRVIWRAEAAKTKKRWLDATISQSMFLICFACFKPAVCTFPFHVQRPLHRLRITPIVLHNAVSMALRANAYLLITAITTVIKGLRGWRTTAFEAAGREIGLHIQGRSTDVQMGSVSCFME